MIDIFFDEIEINDEYIELVNKVLNKCFEVKEIKGYISVTLTDDKNIMDINKQYRNINKPTDVLSFPILEKEEIDNLKNVNNSNIVKQIMLGDIIISIPRVNEQKDEYNHSFERELAYMLVHGFCHLIGYDHIEEQDKIIMRKEEEKILNSLNITREKWV